jgi:hypothetical protein
MPWTISLLYRAVNSCMIYESPVLALTCTKMLPYKEHGGGYLKKIKSVGN